MTVPTSAHPARPPIEAADRPGVFVPHAFDEHLVDVGEVRLNYATAGTPDRPALLLVPAQSESWWGYETVIGRLAETFQVFAVDLRGQGRSTWTPGRYTLDNFGNDLVRFIDLVIGRPTVVSGLSSGGVIAAWLSAYARPGQVRAAVWEDPPLFSSEPSPSCGQSIHQAIGPVFTLWHKWLGDQWSIGDWAGMQKAFPTEIPGPILRSLTTMMPPPENAPPSDDPPQNLREYDPEWGRAFVSGAASASCSHDTMLSQVKVPILLTHHFRTIDEASGRLVGALSDLQARRVRELVTAAGRTIRYESFPQMPHSMHEHDPERYVDLVLDWWGGLDEL